MFMTGPRPRSRHQQRCVRDATDFEFFISFYCKTTIGQGLSEVCNIATGMLMKVLVRYIVTGCIFCAPSVFVTGQVWTPSGTPLPSWQVSAPPPPREASTPNFSFIISFYSSVTVFESSWRGDSVDWQLISWLLSIYSSAMVLIPQWQVNLNAKYNWLITNWSRTYRISWKENASSWHWGVHQTREPLMHTTL